MVEFTRPYQASDGEIFPTEEEALNHEQLVSDKADVLDFVEQDSQFTRKGQGTRAKNIILAFIEWQRGRNKQHIT